MTTFVWSVTKMYCKPQEDNYQDVVISAYWQCVGTDGDFSVTALGSSDFELSTNFVPYDQLTEEEVLDWCWASYGGNKDYIESIVQSDLDKIIMPNVISIPLPWAV